MNESTENLLNTTCNSKHCSLEKWIKEEDPAQDKSRAGYFKRAVLVAEPVDDWVSMATLLSDLKLDKDAPQFTNFQAKYDSETREALNVIKEKMQKSLIKGNIIKRVLQTQYMLQLLMINYIEHIRAKKLTIKADKMVDDEIDLPEMAALFTEMILTDRDCEALKQIRRIMVDWRNS